MESPLNPFDKNRQNSKARDEWDETGNHFDNLFDVDEDAAGERIDLVTGKPIDNTTNMAANDSELGIIERPGTTDALPDLPEEDDAAAQWLREHPHG